MPKKLLVALITLTISGLLSSSIEINRVEADGHENPLDALIVDFYPLPEGNLPLKKIMKHKIEVTNSGSTALNIEFLTEVIEPYPQVIETVTPEPNFLWLEPGQTEYIYTKMDEKWGEIPAFLPWEDNQIGSHQLTYRWTFTDTTTLSTKTWDVVIPYEIVETERRVYETTPENLQYQDITARGENINGPISYAGNLVNELGDPLPNMEVFVTTGNWRTIIPETGDDGSFEFGNLPERDDWVIIAQEAADNSILPAGSTPVWNDTRQPRAIKFINESDFDLTLELRYPLAKADYTLSETIKPDVGFWRGDVDDDGKFILLINGMENWSVDYPNQETKSLLSLYSISGDLIWSYNMGWEGWGTSISNDGTYAAFTTSNCSGKANRPVPEGACGKFGVLNASNGSTIWTKEGSDITLTTHPELASKEIQISNTNKYLGVGGVEGTFLLYDLKSGDLLWTSFLRGQIRGILFDDNDEYIYAGAGDGYTYKLSATDGSVIWKTYNGSWPYLGAFKFSKTRDLIAAGGKYGDLAVIETDTGNLLWYKDFDDIVSWLDFSPNGKYLVAGGGGQYSTTLLDARTGEKLWHVPFFSHSGMFSNDGNYILADTVLLDINGREIGNFSLSKEGCRPGCDGLFSYISDDMTTIIHTRRDMDPGGIGLYFWQGNLQEEEPKAVTSTVSSTITDSNPPSVSSTITDSNPPSQDVEEPPSNDSQPKPPPGFDSSNLELSKCLIEAIGAERFDELSNGTGPLPNFQEQLSMIICYQKAEEGPPTSQELTPTQESGPVQSPPIPPEFDSSDPELSECLIEAIGAERFDELSNGSGPPPSQQEQMSMGPCYQETGVAPPTSQELTPTQESDPVQSPPIPPEFDSSDPKLSECLIKVIGIKRFDELSNGSGPLPSQQEQMAMWPCYQETGVAPPTSQELTPTQESDPVQSPPIPPEFDSSDPKLSECLIKVIGIKRFDELNNGSGPLPSQQEQMAMWPCYQETGITPPTSQKLTETESQPTATTVPAATPIPTATTVPTATPIPTATTVPTVTPITTTTPSPVVVSISNATNITPTIKAKETIEETTSVQNNQSSENTAQGGGCGSSLGTTGPLDIGLILLASICPILVGRAKILRF